MMARADPGRQWDRPAKFLLVGLGNTLLSLSTIAIMLHAGLNDYAANLTGYIVGFINSFLMNRRFSFGRKTRISSAEVSGFAIAAAIAYGINVAALAVAREVVGTNSIVIHIPAMAAYTMSFYLLSARLAFRERRS